MGKKDTEIKRLTLENSALFGKVVALELERDEARLEFKAERTRILVRLDAARLGRTTALGRLDAVLKALDAKREELNKVRAHADALQLKLDAALSREQPGNEARRLNAVIADVEARQARIEELKRELSRATCKAQNLEHKAAKVDKLKGLLVELFPEFDDSNW